MPLFRQRRDVEVALRLPALESLFVAPDDDPFSPEYETYGDQSGLDFIASRLRSEKGKGRVRAIVELPAEEIEPTLEQRAEEAVGRYCRVKVQDLSRSLREVTRQGLRALLLGLLAVLVLNGIAESLEASRDSLLKAVVEGLQVTSWVILWVPINLLVYNRSFYSRDRKIYRRLERMEIRIVPRRGSSRPT
ncbi:MAG: hypothetical protein ACREJR_00935 [Candidatus Rokuibacteriota bacterium]